MGTADTLGAEQRRGLLERSLEGRPASVDLAEYGVLADANAVQ
jgi:hypothetical protein